MSLSSDDSAGSALHQHHHDGGSGKIIAVAIFDVVKNLCEYIIPRSAEVMWWSIGLGAFFSDAFILQYLFMVHLFTDTYIASMMSKMYGDLVGAQCGGGGDKTKFSMCYCAEGQDLASFFWVVLVVYAEYVRGPLIIWKAAILFVAFAVYAVGLIIGGMCSVTGALFAVCAGTFLGAIKIYGYAAICEPMVSAAARRHEIECALSSLPAQNENSERHPHLKIPTSVTVVPRRQQQQQPEQKRGRR